MKARLRLGATAMFLLAAFLAPTPAQAAAKKAPDPATTASTEIVRSELVVTDGATTRTFQGNGPDIAAPLTTATATASGCQEITGTYKGLNVVGDVQITFTQVADWCWSGGTITFKSSDYHQTSPGEFWSFNKLTDSSSSSNSSMWIRSRTGWFHQCFPGGYGCLRNSYPWVKFYMYGNGAYSMSWGA